MLNSSAPNSFGDSHSQKDREMINNYQIAQSNSPSSMVDGLRILVVDDNAEKMYPRNAT